MFEETLPKKLEAILKEIIPILTEKNFYLGGGTGLALQIGHRISEDLDFFTEVSFNPNSLYLLLKSRTRSQKEIIIETNTLLMILDGVRCSFFYNDVPLIYKPIVFEGMNVADWRDIIAEKFKTLSQRGSKKDFYDIFCVLYSNRLNVEEAVSIFKKRFEHSGINFYHVLRSLSYFEDAEEEPTPNMLENYNFSWEEVKNFFIRNLKEFEKYFLI